MDTLNRTLLGNVQFGFDPFLTEASQQVSGQVFPAERGKICMLKITVKKHNTKPESCTQYVCTLLHRKKSGAVW